MKSPLCRALKSVQAARFNRCGGVRQMGIPAKSQHWDELSEVESLVGGSIRLILTGDLRTILCPIDGQSRLKLTL